MSLPAIPGPCLTEAIVAGLSEVTIAQEWAKYAKWSAANYPACNLGGKSWRIWVTNVLEDAKLPKLTTAELVRLENRAEQKRREEAEEVAYQRAAMTFGEWCQLTLDRAARLEEVGGHDLSVARWWAAQPEGQRHYGGYLASLGLTV